MILRFTRYLVVLAWLGVSASSMALAPGDTAPAVSLPRLNGEGNIGLADLQGKVVYVDFWASWCGPCRLSLPALDTIRTAFTAQGFEVLAINVDENISDAEAFLAKYPVTYPVVRDASGATPKSFQIKGMPTAFLLDRQGQVRHVHEGFRNSDKETIAALVSQLLAEP